MSELLERIEFEVNANKECNARIKELEAERDAAYRKGVEDSSLVAKAHINEFYESSWNDTCRSIFDDIRDLLKEQTNV